MKDGNISVTPVVNTEINDDNVSGATTNDELYNTLGPNIRGMADFRERFLQLYPRFTRQSVEDVYNLNQ